MISLKKSYVFYIFYFIVFSLFSFPVFASTILPPHWKTSQFTEPQVRVLAMEAEKGYAYVHALQQGAKENNINAFYGLMIYYSQIKNYPQAILWAKKSAHAGNSVAQEFLGNAYYTGKMIPQNNKKAVYWLSKSADNLNYHGQYFLGYLYQYGKAGLKKNIHKAIQHYEISAREGSYQATIQLTHIYQYGQDKIPVNLKLARHWLNFYGTNKVHRGWAAYNKTYKDFMEYKNPQKLVLQKEEKQIKNHQQSTFTWIMLTYFTIIFLALLVQVRKTWLFPQGSSVIFWGTSSFFECIFALVYFFQALTFSNFAAWTTVVAFSLTAFTTGTIAFLAFLNRKKRILLKLN